MQTKITLNIYYKNVELSFKLHKLDNTLPNPMNINAIPLNTDSAASPTRHLHRVTLMYLYATSIKLKKDQENKWEGRHNTCNFCFQNYPNGTTFYNT